ncbi:MAG: CDP-diacylglycerol--glycerol-3-phosphate 3-phosphatidyltransferase [Actinophytocola sp.]|uniref:CDP-diacylglycerol--glycerol-3-phosphate 3-phosphatidyltransferase n=1 Tax=Actinophytocola sp. TaxID=1872138 RepID=UPI003C77ED63
MSATPADGTPPAGAAGEALGPAVAQVPLVNIANILTVTRLVLVPVFLLALFADGGVSEGWRMVAFLVFAVGSITDFIDGHLARKYGLVTDFGKVVDPIADKALTGAALIGLSALGELPWWVTLTIAGREILVTLLRFWVIRYGVIAASYGGKVKTFAQIIAIGLYLLPLPAALDPLLWAGMGIALALTVVTGVDYVVRALRLRATRA